MTSKSYFIVCFALFSFFVVSLVEAVKTRIVEEKDLEQIHKYLENPLVTLQTSRIPYPISLENVTNWYEDAKERNRQGLLYSFAITPDDIDEVMGVIELKRETSDSKAGELGYWLGQEYWGKGYMSSAINQVTSFAFNELSLSTVEAYCLEDNVGSIRALKKNAFVEQPGTVSQWMPARARTGIFVLLRCLSAF